MSALNEVLQKHINLFFDLKEICTLYSPLDLPIVLSNRQNFNVSQDYKLSFYQSPLIATIQNNLNAALDTGSKFFILNFKDTDIGWICTAIDRKVNNATILFLLPCQFKDDHWTTYPLAAYPSQEEVTISLKELSSTTELHKEYKEHLDMEVTRSIASIQSSLSIIASNNLPQLYFYYAYFFLCNEDVKNKISVHSPTFISEAWTIIQEQIINIGKRMKEAVSKIKLIKESEKTIEGAEETATEIQDRYTLLKDSIPEDVRKVWEKEHKKLSYTHSHSPDYAKITEYLETILDIPFNKESANNISIKELQEALDKQHYGLSEVKRSIVEHIALQRFSNKSYGEVLCLVGPPGTGKSSISNTIASVLNRKHIKIALGGISDESELRGHRSAQPLDAKILTPSGWITMGEVKEGTIVCTPNGKNAKVIGIYPQGKKPIYEITFNDKSKTRCCDEHLWKVQNKYQRDVTHEWSIKHLKDIKDNLHDGYRNNYRIPFTEPVNFEQENDLKVDPYLLGCLLGDGCFSGAIILSSADKEIIDECTRLAALNNCSVSYKGNYHYTIKTNIIGKSTIENISNNEIRKELMKYGLWRKTARHKFIPTPYKFGNKEQRLALLQGLMDTDGSIRTKGGSETIFCTTSPQLVTDVRELVWSLGGRATYQQTKCYCTLSGEKREGLPYYKINIKMPDGINPFHLERKAKYVKPPKGGTLYRYITDVTLISNEEAQCILLDDEDHLYITDDYIVTHNTYVGAKPGRLIEGLVKCQTIDPVIVLDEVDKITTFRGSPADALLEILDPEQNDHFVDRYLSFSIDISKAMFLCTANFLEQMSDPLKDRMHIITIEGYSFEEQFIIAKDYIIPKYASKYNMGEHISISDDLIEKLCEKKKTGMRTMERAVRDIFKKSAYTLLSEELTKLDLNADNCLKTINYELIKPYVRKYL